jgi:murein DD-endopeptidase MepM/ murein hydrolase activator NlpD
MSTISLYPLMGSAFGASDFVPVDLSTDSPLLKGWIPGDQQQLAQRIRACVHQHGGRIAYGGYLERRRLYAASAHFGSEDRQRCIHLGLDFWGDIDMPVYAPMAGKVHSLAYNGAHLDYGATIVLEHQTTEGVLFTLYGHLSITDLERLQPGQQIHAGSVVGHVGPPSDNGGWAPHLHFQCIRDMGCFMGDFPGVCSTDQAPAYRHLCPDPMGWVVLEG